MLALLDSHGESLLRHLFLQRSFEPLVWFRWADCGKSAKVFSAGSFSGMSLYLAWKGNDVGLLDFD